MVSTVFVIVFGKSVWEAADSCGLATEARSGVKASSLPTGQVAVKRAFLSADSRLSGENYKVFKTEHYLVCRSEPETHVANDEQSENSLLDVYVIGHPRLP